MLRDIRQSASYWIDKYIWTLPKKKIAQTHTHVHKIIIIIIINIPIKMHMPTTILKNSNWKDVYLITSK